MARQIESAEKRATIRCPVYNPRNMHWKICDDLIKTHNELVSSITSKTEALFSNENDEKDDDGDDTVGTFLNQPSPTKKRRAAVVEEVQVKDSEVAQNVSTMKRRSSTR